MCIDIFANGLVLGRNAFLASNWNRFDLVITLSSLAAIVASIPFNLLVLRACRVLRVLKYLFASKVSFSTIYYKLNTIGYYCTNDSSHHEIVWENFNVFMFCYDFIFYDWSAVL